MKRLLLSILFFLVFLKMFAQTPSAVDTLPSALFKLEWQGYGGVLLAHSDKMSQFAHTPYWGQEVRAAFQTTGKAYWHSLYKYPIYGVGLYSGHYQNDALGNPLAVFAFMEFPFYRTQRQYFTTSWGIGTSFHFNEYDPEVNAQNTAIGSDVNVYVDFSLNYRRKLTKRLELGTGLKLQHFSNGAMKHPNLGLNNVALQAILAYNPGKTMANYAKAEPDKLPKPFEITLMYAGGWRAKSMEENDVLYYNSTISTCFSKRVNYKRTFGIGADVFKNDYLVEYLDDTVNYTNADLMSYAIFGGTDMVVNRLRMSVQLGFYVYRQVDYSVPYYERVAIRYYFLPRTFANISIKAHAAKAQNIEWGIGVTL